ncbi:MAG: hypothetical protein ACPHX0_03270, partial [Flavobacteriales bacterium]
MDRFLFLTALCLVGCQATSGERHRVEMVPRMLPDSVERVQVADYPLGPIEDAEGNLWLGSVGSGAFMWDGQELHEFHAEDGLVGDRVTGLTLGPEGHLWFVSAEEHMGGRSALMTWDGESLERATHPVGFPANPIRPFFDNEDALWVQSTGQFHREVNG